jgi:hypothetical protein
MMAIEGGCTVLAYDIAWRTCWKHDILLQLSNRCSVSCKCRSVRMCVYMCIRICIYIYACMYLCIIGWIHAFVGITQAFIVLLWFYEL